MQQTRHEFLAWTIGYGACVAAAIVLPDFLSLSEPVARWLSPALVAVLSLAYALAVRQHAIRRVQQTRDTLDQLLSTFSEDARTQRPVDSAQLLELVQTERFQRHKMLTDITTAARIAAATIERATQVLDQVVSSLKTMAPAIRTIVSLEDPRQASSPAAEVNEDLAERIARLRYELERFSEIPRSLLQQLQMIYQRYLADTAHLLESQGSLLASVSAQLSPLEDDTTAFTAEGQALFQEITGFHQLAEDIQHSLSRQEQTLARIADTLAHCEEQQPAVMQGITETPAMADRLESLLTDLATLTNRTKILSLNATVFAADSGEAGHGFDMIAREMKALAAESAHLQEQIRDDLDQLRQRFNQTGEGIQGLLSHINIIRQSHQDLLNSLDGLRQAQHTLVATTQETENRQTQWEQSFREHQERLRAIRSELAQSSRTITDRQKEITETQGLKFEIDRMIIETDRFSEKLTGEMPRFLESLGSILDYVAALEDQVNRIWQAVRPARELALDQQLASMQAALDSPLIKQLADLPPMLSKGRRYETETKTS